MTDVADDSALFDPQRWGLPAAAVLDLDLRLVQSLDRRERRYTPIRRYPSSAFDLSVIAGVPRG